MGMMDKRQVMYDIERCICHVPDACRDCSHYPDKNGGPIGCMEDLLSEALELLKEQEAKKVIESTNMYTGLPITHCPKCGVSIDRYLYGRQHEGQINYCPVCGQAVKWE